MADKPPVWVIGGAGYIGSQVCSQLSTKGFAPVVWDNFSTGNAKLVKNHQIVEIDIRDTRDFKILAVQTAAVYGLPRAIIHLAAGTSVAEGELKKDDYYETNVLGTFNVAGAAKKIGCPHLVFASSAAVYGDGRASADAKNLKPLNHYGHTKLTAEKLLKDLFEPHMNISVLRYFNVSGARFNLGRPSNECWAIIPSMVRAYLSGAPIEIRMRDAWHGTVYPVRDFIHVADVAYATVWRALNPAGHGIHVENVGRGIPVSLLQLTKAFNTVCRSDIGWELVPVAENEVMRSVAEMMPPWANKNFTSLECMISSELSWQQSTFFKDLTSRAV